MIMVVSSGPSLFSLFHWGLLQMAKWGGFLFMNISVSSGASMARMVRIAHRLF